MQLISFIYSHLQLAVITVIVIDPQDEKERRDAVLRDQARQAPRRLLLEKKVQEAFRCDRVRLPAACIYAWLYQ
jgi:hypothetical protein